MRTRVLCLPTIILAMAVQTFAASPTQPVIVARVNRHDISEAIPTTILFTPSHTGLFRVSTYMTMASQGAGGLGQLWRLWVDYFDGASAESVCLSSLDPSEAPPGDTPYGCYDSSLASPFMFEAVAGQPVAFHLNAPGHDPKGTVSVAIVVEKLE